MDAWWRYRAGMLSSRPDTNREKKTKEATRINTTEEEREQPMEAREEKVKLTSVC